MESNELRKIVKMFIKGIQAFAKIFHSKKELSKYKPKFDSYELYKNLDQEEKGYFDEEDLSDFLTRMGQKFTSPQVGYIFRIFNKSKSGRVSFEEFIQTVYCDELSEDQLCIFDQSAYKYRFHKPGEKVSKIDLCMFFKTFYEEHLELDLTIRALQDSPLSIMELFKLLNPTKSSVVSLEELILLLNDYFDMGSLF